ncbi:TPA_asm: DUF3850 domain-containing protein [Listeria innocua]|uniref:Lin1741 protein n=1 Tax=Listeria innocua serovar 6a (strain ATCC BAA-680 / CLIP 11262) TaxID=272626 RepID=Q92B12_LISIN|nr:MULTISPECIES: DUF3850 domain-containing protein [Listeria]YP_001468773.1 RNA-binding protein [Listeria phage B054]AAY53173.1 gp69 [Listeria phage B054]EAC2823281.1 DUF3850 domain-containing protein [Listeria monocytogenes]EAC4403246.1 DUF3850 domain-containing protein [Listeria monocytogenes]EAC5314078.1 DUF3850 domain-containing protein [Listeria monocytogenes]EAC6434238.1 DUF3850 domain-containing protein [Listeria monocytogenes]
MTVHKLKILPEFFEKKRTLVKAFEIRKNDRNFMVGDTLILQEYVNGEYTGREYWEDVVYITDYLQKEGIVVMGTLPNEREYPF